MKYYGLTHLLIRHLSIVEPIHDWTLTLHQTQCNWWKLVLKKVGLAEKTKKSKLIFIIEFKYRATHL